MWLTARPNVKSFRNLPKLFFEYFSNVRWAWIRPCSPLSAFATKDCWSCYCNKMHLWKFLILLFSSKLVATNKPSSTHCCCYIWGMIKIYLPRSLVVSVFPVPAGPFEIKLGFLLDLICWCISQWQCQKQWLKRTKPWGAPPMIKCRLWVRVI